MPVQTKESSRLLSVVQLAEILGVSRSHAYALVRERAVPAIRFNGAIRVPAAALDRWLDEREQEALDSVRSGSP
jgi:excisionase family DNA binding protein